MSDLLPMVSGGTALEMSEKLTATLGAPEYLDSLPPELFSFIKNRFIIPSELVQPDMPLLGGGEGFKVTYLKKITGQTKDKAFGGVDQPDGTILGKTPFVKPFPFIVMLAWTTRQYGYWDSVNNVMVTHCESRDSVVPCMVNEWGATTCVSCPHHSANRPKWGDDKDQDGRCRQKIQVIGIGGDWRDIYVLQVQGQGIIDFYSNQIGKELSIAKGLGEPYYMRTFMIGTEKDRRGNHQFKIQRAMPTLRRSDLPPSIDVMWDFKNVEERERRNFITNAALANIQRLCMQYRDEFQAAGTRQLQQQMALESGLEQDTKDAKSTSSAADDMDLT